MATPLYDADRVRSILQVGGQTICDGDVVVADNDGVVVIRESELDCLAARAMAICAWEQRTNELVEAGKTWQEAKNTR